MVRSPCLLWYAEKRNATVASSKENCARRSVTFDKARIGVRDKPAVFGLQKLETKASIPIRGFHVTS